MSERVIKPGQVWVAGSQARTVLRVESGIVVFKERVGAPPSEHDWMSVEALSSNWVLREQEETSA